MASLKDPDVRIQVLVRRDTSEGRFQDAIYLSADEFAAMTDQEIEDLKSARADSWCSMVKAARSAKPAEPTAEDLAAMKASIEASRASLDAQLVEVEARLAIAVAAEAEPIGDVIGKG